ncbi:hypothetical protein D3C83_283880 [compost metagenome]
MLAALGRRCEQRFDELPAVSFARWTVDAREIRGLQIVRVMNLDERSVFEHLPAFRNVQNVHMLR